MDYFNTILESSQMPWLSALVLGLMTAISPCPLATNITAVGFISKELNDRRRVFRNGLLYTLGRAISYTVIAVVIYLGADQFQLGGFLQRYGDKFLGPLLILIGLFMLGILRFHFPQLSGITSRMEKKQQWGYFDALWLGMVFALAFCPYSGVLYFGMLIPMTITSASGLYLPFVFALATGLPVILFAWILAFTVSSLGSVYRSVQLFEKWFRRAVAIAFIAIGIYYIVRLFL